MTDESITSTPDVDPDGRVAVALAALAEVTDPADVGPLLDAEQVVPGVVDLRFASTLAGYTDWRWTVSTSAIPGVDPTVLEVGLLPGEGSLLAPPWVPWTERLAEWRRLHPHDDETADDADGDDEDADDDDLDEELDEDVLDDEVDVEDIHADGDAAEDDEVDDDEDEDDTEADDEVDDDADDDPEDDVEVDRSY